MSKTDLAHVIAGCKLNDPVAQRDLYRLYALKAKKICTRFLKNPAEAEEAADDGLLKVFMGINSFDENKNFEPWFKQIITRSMYDHLRIKNSKLKTSVLHTDCPHFKNPNAITKANYKDLICIIEKLPPGYKTIFTMYHIEGFDHDEISKQLNISPATSRSNLMKARRKLLGWINESTDRNKLKT